MAILRVRDAEGNVHDISCIKGKSAYEYAVDGGYSGTESEFAEKMAQEQLAGSTSDLTPTDVYNAISEGRTVWITHTDSNYGVMKFNFFLYSVVLPGVASVGIFEMNSVPISAQLLGNTNSNIWTVNVNFLAKQSDIPTTLKNPNALTFVGAATGTYDGSEPVEIKIPTIKGEPGYTPQKGVDYWTDEDKTEIVNSVLAALPDGSEVSY